MPLSAKSIVESKWVDLASAFNSAEETRSTLLSNLVTALSEPHRSYHNPTHIAALLALITEYEAEFDRPDLANWVALYHDAVYNTKRKDNEEASADLAAKDLKSLGMDTEDVDWVVDTIRRTKSHDGKGANQDSLLFLDMDLSILASSPDTYKKYASDIRSEYKWVPKFIYRKERKKVLQKFLERSSIYYTEVFRSRFEEQARANIQSELK